MNFNNPMDQIQFMAVGGGLNNNYNLQKKIKIINIFY